MSAAAEAAVFGRTDHLSTSESADQDDASSVRVVRNGAVTDAAADATGNRNIVKHRVLKTACLYVSFGGMVRSSGMFHVIRSVRH